MWAVVGILSLLAIPVLGLLGVSHAVRGTGRARRHFECAGLALVLLVVSASHIPGLQVTDQSRQDVGPEVTPGESVILGKPPAAGALSVSVLDVGQADAIAIALPDGKVMLVDTATASAAHVIVDFLESAGIKKIDYLVLTHPHEDHIGGAAEILKTFDIDRIFMPRISHTTEVYEDLLLAISDKGLTVTEAKTGVLVVDAAGLKIQFISPGASYEELNDWSAVLTITYGRRTIVLAGDAAAAAERDMLQAGLVPDADVLKVGHHGSQTSTGDKFLKALTPRVAVISVGKDNTYGCPAESTLSRLAATGAAIYRTDLNGTVTVTTDGETLTVRPQRGEPLTLPR